MTPTEMFEMLKRERLLVTLKALPYAHELQVFGSVVRGTNPYPRDIDLMIDLRGRADADSHPCFDDIPLLNQIYSPPILIDFLAITDTATRKLMQWGYVDLPAFVGALGFEDRPAVPLLNVERWGSACLTQLELIGPEEIAVMLSKERLLAALKALPYADKIYVFGSVARKNKPNPRDIDIVLFLTGQPDAEQHPAFYDFELLGKLYPDLLDAFIITDDANYKVGRSTCLHMPLLQYFLSGRAPVPLLSIERWGSGCLTETEIEARRQ